MYQVLLEVCPLVLVINRHSLGYFTQHSLLAEGTYLRTCAPGGGHTQYKDIYPSIRTYVRTYSAVVGVVLFLIPDAWYDLL